MGHYVLDDLGNPVKTDDLLFWAKTIDDIKLRRVARTVFSNKTVISTVFLGIDYGSETAPLLFETLCPGDVEDRYPTWAKALRGHKNIVARHIRQGGGAISVQSHEERELPKQPDQLGKPTIWERLTTKDPF